MKGEKMKNTTLKTGWAEIRTRNPKTGEIGTLIGNIREVKELFSEVEIPKWDGQSEEIVTRSVPNQFLTNIED